MAKRIIIAALGVLLVCAMSVFGFRAYRLHQEKKAEWKNWLGLRALLKEEVISFRGTSAIIVKDLKRNWQLAHNPKMKFASASLVKIPIMVICYLAQEEGRLSLQDKIVLKEKDKVSGSGVLKALRPGRSFSVYELVELMISKSDNTAANMLIELLGEQYLNDKFIQLGLKDTTLVRKMMHFKKRKNGNDNYTTSKDIALLLEKIYRGNYFGDALSRECIQHLKNQKYRDRIPARLPAQTEVAHKTGLERKICHDAGIIFSANGDMLVVVLTKNARSFRSAKNYISQIALHSYNYRQNCAN